MGRYADNILTKNHIPHISIFITAPKKLRIQRTYHTSKEKLTYKQAAKYVSKEDKAHLKRYAFYTARSGVKQIITTSQLTVQLMELTEA